MTRDWPASAPEINVIHQVDALELLRRIPNGCVDLIIADPPYNLGPSYKSGKNWQRDPQWSSWCKEWLTECKRVLTNDGSIFVYGIHHYACFVQVHLYELGMTYRRQFIWTYENNFSGYVKTPSAQYEPLLWFSKGESYTYEPIREPYKSTERLKHRIIKNGKVWTPHPDGRMVGDVWKFPVLAGKRFSAERVAHPTQKPLNLTDRIVRHFSKPGDVILVPFAGSGTECVSAYSNGRRFVAAEIVQDYIEISEERLRSAASKLAV